MKQTNRFKIIGGVLFLALLAIGITTSLLLWKSPERKPGKVIEKEIEPQKVIEKKVRPVNLTVVSHNTFGKDNNVFETITRLKKFSKIDNVSVEQSVHSLSKVKANIENHIKTAKIKQFFFERNIKKLVAAVYEEIGLMKESAEIDQIVENFLVKNQDILLEDYFNDYDSKLQAFDKTIRSSTSLPSPIFYNTAFLGRIKAFLTQSKNGVNESLKGFFTDPWIQTIRTCLLNSYEVMSLSPEDFVDIVIAYYLRQNYIFVHICAANALEHLVNVARYYQEKLKNKSEGIAQMYVSKQASFISLQNVEQGLDKYLCTIHNYNIASQEGLNMAPANDQDILGSMNFYKKSFIENNNYRLTHFLLKREEVEKYQGDVTDEDFNRLFGREVCINQLENEQHIIIHVNFHADSQGGNTKVFLRAIFDVIHQVKTHTSKPVYAIICLDGKFTTQDHGAGCRVDSISSIVTDSDCKILQYGDTSVNTAHLDGLIIVSDNVKLSGIYLGSSTMLADHRPIVAHIQVV